MQYQVSLAVLCLAGAHGGAAAQYKCTQPDGAVSFQQHPCQTNDRSQKLAIRAAPTAQEAERPTEIQAAMAARTPVVGMTLKELEILLGKPQKISTTQFDGKTTEQLLFYRGRRTFQVQAENGIATFVQDMEGGKPDAPRAIATSQGKPCLNARQIRDIEIEMNKFQNRDNARLRADLQRQYAEARNCGR